MKRTLLVAICSLLVCTQNASSLPSCSTPDTTYRDLLTGLPDELALGRSVEFLTDERQQPLDLQISSAPFNLVTGPLLYSWRLAAPQTATAEKLTVTARWEGEEAFGKCEQAVSTTVDVVPPVAPSAWVKVVPTPAKGDHDRLLNIVIGQDCVLGGKGPITVSVISGKEKAGLKLSDQCGGKWTRKRKLETFTVAGGDDYLGNRYVTLKQTLKRGGRKKFKLLVTWQGKKLLSQLAITRTRYHRARLVRSWRVP